MSRTMEQLNAELAAISDGELAEQARKALSNLIHGKTRMCIPVEPTDDDMVISEVIRRVKSRQEPFTITFTEVF